MLTYSQASLDAAHTAAGAAVTVRLYGTDEQALSAAAQRRPAVTGHGARDRRLRACRRQTDEPAIQITANVTAAARYGLKPGDIRRQTSVLVAGIPVGSYYQQQQIYDVTVWSEPAVRGNLSAIENLPLDTPNDGKVPLKKVATVAIEPAPTEIDHDQVSRYLDVTADVRGADLGSVVAHVRRQVQSVALPLGYHAEVFSDLQQRQGADRRTLFWALACRGGDLPAAAGGLPELESGGALARHPAAGPRGGPVGGVAGGPAADRRRPGRLCRRLYHRAAQRHSVGPSPAAAGA